MFTTNAAPTVYFDVDSTLVFTEAEAPKNIQFDYIKINTRHWLVHRQHVDAVKDFWARGHNVIIWSQGGAKWATMVAEALGISTYVHACLSKPLWYFDDKCASEWLMPHQRSYIQPK